jgi:hypothetical protein
MYGMVFEAKKREELTTELQGGRGGGRGKKLDNKKKGQV